MLKYIIPTPLLQELREIQLWNKLDPVCNRSFARRLITREGTIDWPPRSPDPTSIDFLILGT